MSRGIWFVAGAGAGAYAVARARRTAESFTVGGMHDRLTGWFAGAKVLAEEAGAARAEKRAELEERLAASTMKALETGSPDPAPDNVRPLRPQDTKTEEGATS